MESPPRAGHRRGSPYTAPVVIAHRDAPVRLRLLGGFEVEGLAAHRLGTRKARTLLMRLALARGRPVVAGELIDVLWGEAPGDRPARPEPQLSVLVSRLRTVLGAGRLPREDAGYRLVADWLDVDALATLATEAARRLRAGQHALARGAGEAALALARGPLLPEEPDAAWAAADRTAVERLVAEVRQTVARAALAGGDPGGPPPGPLKPGKPTRATRPPSAC